MKSKIGFGAEPITPPFKTRLCGYDFERVFTDVHDDLYVRAILLSVDEEFICFVQLDNIGNDKALKIMLLKQLEKNWGIIIKEENLIISSSHTHSAPCGYIKTEGALKNIVNIFGGYNEELVAFTVEQAAKAVGVASKDMKEFKLKTAHSKLEGIGTNRHSPDLLGDNTLFSMVFERIDNKKILMYNFSCHPTILSGESTSVTSDLPWGVVDRLKNDFDMVMFTNGCCGDISTRFTRKGSTFSEVSRLGGNLGDKLLEMQETDDLAELKAFKLKTFNVTLNTKKCDSLTIAKEKYEKALKQLEKVKQEKDLTPSQLRVYESIAEGSKTNMLISDSLEGITEIELEVTILKVNDTIFATVPCELFSSLGNKIKEAGNVVVLGYSNGYFLYIPDEDAYDQGYYEALSSPFAKGEGERLAEAIVTELREFI